MRSILALAACVAAGLLGAPPAAAAPLEAYGRLPSIESVVISPSGHAVAMVATNGEQRIIVVQDLATKASLLNGYTGDEKVRGVQWADDRRLILMSSRTSTSFEIRNGNREWFFGSLVDVPAKKMTPMMRNSKSDFQMIFGMPAARTRAGKTVVFPEAIMVSGDRGRISLFGIDLDNGTNRLVSEGAPDTRNWLVDTDGEVLAREQYNSGTGLWVLQLRRGGLWTDAVRVSAPLDPPRMLGMGRDKDSVIYGIRADDGRFEWREVRRDGNDPGAPIPVGPAQSSIRARDGLLLGYYNLVGDEDVYTFFDPEDQRVWRAVTAAYPGQRVILQDWTADRRKIVVLVESPSEAPAFALVDLETRSARWLGEQFASLKAHDISERKPFRFKAADGLDIPGYLTLPRGREPKGLPLIVFPHGGPAVRDTPDFDWWAQGMASRGYAVLQVNYRGSDGLGSRHLEAGYGEWGRKMQTDLSDGVRRLAALGVIDPARVCIVGASYGGYAALAGATLDQGVYRCAVSVGGVSDLSGLIGFSAGRSGPAATRYWTRFIGAERRDDPVIAQYSPLHFASAADSPILLIHGKDDTVVPADQSQRMAEALRKAGKPHELILQKGADHWLSRGETRLETLTATMAFVEKHNPPH
ncbi:S9 family peptidase [Phenylobacterium sp.]|uniref:alpha/beta hydrolase family protein n=1 Tax=Phenylobacterium sp. TaxID=1871053 RepID=UPI00301D35FA